MSKANFVLFFLLIPFISLGTNTIETLKDSLSHFQGLKKANVLYEIGYSYFPNNNDSTLKYVEKAFLEYQHINYAKGIVNCQGLMGVVYSGYGMYDTAIALIYKVIEWGEENNDICSFIGYLELANIYKNLENIAKAKEYYLKAINGNYLPAKMAAYANMGLLNLAKENFDSASFYFNSSLQEYYKSDTSLSINKYNIATIYLNLASVEYGLGNYEEGIKLINKSYLIFNEIGNKAITANINFRLGEGYEYLQKNKTALEYYLRAKEIANSNKTPAIRETIYYKLFDYYKERGEYEKALVHILEYEKIHDSLIAARYKSSIVEMEVKYSLKQKDNMITNLKKEKQNIRVIAISIIVGLLSLSLIIIVLINYRRLRLRNAKLLSDAESRLSSAKAETAEQELKRIVLSLHEKSAFIEELEAEMQNLSITGELAHMKEKVQLLRTTRILTDNDWEEYSRAFNEIHPLFCDGIENYDALSIGDKRQLIFLKLGLKQKEIAHLMGISHEGVKRARQRLSKKIGLNNASELRGFVGSL